MNGVEGLKPEALDESMIDHLIFELEILRDYGLNIEIPTVDEIVEIYYMIDEFMVSDILLRLIVSKQRLSYIVHIMQDLVRVPLRFVNVAIYSMNDDELNRYYWIFEFLVDHFIDMLVFLRPLPALIIGRAALENGVRVLKRMHMDKLEWSPRVGSKSIKLLGEKGVMKRERADYILDVWRSLSEYVVHFKGVFPEEEKEGSEGETLIEGIAYSYDLLLLEKVEDLIEKTVFSLYYIVNCIVSHSRVSRRSVM